MTLLTPRVLIIGAGATGAGLLRDLALRGVQALLIEQRDVNSGASGGNHGLLHSGARYVASDREAAVECREEGDILRRLAPQCIEDTGGLFVAVRGDDERYASDFPGLCAKSGVPCRGLELRTAKAMEPALAEDVIAAFAVQDGAVDPFMLSLDNLAQGLSVGGSMRRNLAATSMEVVGGRVCRVGCRDMTTGEEVVIEAELVINASGAWAGMIAALAGARIGILYSMGSLVITQDRIATRVINRLRPPSDADILVPGGTVSILGTTSIRVPSPDGCRPSVAETDRIIDDARRMLPILERTRYIRAYAGVRPLVSLGPAGDDRAVSLGFALIDHAADGVDNFMIITEQPLTTGIFLQAKVIGVMKFIDDGEVDDKIIVVPADDRNNGNAYNSLEDLPAQLIKQLDFHFNHYKDLKKPGATKVEGFFGVDVAKEVIIDSQKRWKEM